MSAQLTILIPTYCENLDYLEQAIRSVLKQTYKDYEVLIVDDHGPKDPEKLVEKINHPKVRFVRQEKNRGMFANMDYSIKEYINTPYVFILCQDDILTDENYFLRAMPILLKNEADCALAGYQTFTEEDKKFEDHLFHWEKQVESGNKLFREFWSKRAGQIQDLPWITLIFSREEYLKRIPLSRPELVTNDLSLSITMVLNQKVYCDPHAIVAYRVHTLSYSGKEKDFHPSHFDKMLAKLGFIDHIVEKARLVGLSEREILSWEKRIQKIAVQGKVDEIFKDFPRNKQKYYLKQLEERYPSHFKRGYPKLLSRYRLLKSKAKGLISFLSK